MTIAIQLKDGDDTVLYCRGEQISQLDTEEFMGGLYWTHAHKHSSKSC